MTTDVKDPLAPPRSVSLTIDLDAPVDLVWRALTDPAALVQWFPTTAAVDPRPGGPFTISWDGLWQWDMVVTTWEPNRRLTLRNPQARPFDAAGHAQAAAPAVELTLEFTLDAHGDRTTLRLVQSGFGHGASWDDEVDGVAMGWHIELRGLQHYLAHHRGQPRSTAWASAVTGRTIAEAWSHLVGPSGIVRRGFSADLRDGDRCRLDLSTGDTLDGRVVWIYPGRQLLVAADNFSNALVRLSLDRAAGVTMAQVWLSSWRLPAQEVDAFGVRLRKALDRAMARM
jgi:uncharacterized protein YndB with AHSA1/START domain